MTKRGLLIVMASMAPEKEEAFNRWYNEDHLPKMIERVPTVLSGHRYRVMGVGGDSVPGLEKYRFIAMYEFESYEALEAFYKSDKVKELVGEYNEAWGVGGRHHIRAIELKSYFVR